MKFAPMDQPFTPFYPFLLFRCRVWERKSDLCGSLNLNGVSELYYLFCNRTQINQLDLTGVTALMNLSCSDTRISELDLAENTELEILTCFDTRISELDLTKNTKLSILRCYNTPISELDLTKNTELGTLECLNTRISKLDLTGNTQLEYLNCSNTSISQLDLTELTQLQSLFCSGTQISQLELEGLTRLLFLDCSGTPISQLELTGLNNLARLSCHQTKLTLETLPLSTEITCIYAPQLEIDGGTIQGEADLSAQNRNGNTTYKWYAEGDADTELTDIAGTGGIFTIPSKYGGKTLVCRMTNTDFPLFDNEPLVYKALIKSSDSVEEESASFDKIYVQERNLCVETADRGMLTVYDTAGRLVASRQIVEGKTVIPMETGSYIVVFNDQHKKISVN